MEKAIALLKLYKTVLDFAHWNNKGYADHLLYDRLRKEIGEVLDSCVEKYLAFNKEVKFSDFVDFNVVYLQNYQGFEKEDILELANACYSEFEQERDITDMLATHIYLLKK